MVAEIRYAKLLALGCAFLVLSMGCSGPEGLQGEMGIQGIPGEKGPTGLKGDPGPKGDIGPHGKSGFLGDTGEKGERGPQGEPGAVGFKGAQGPPGEKGIPGLQGPTGLPGSQGDEGARGDKGAKGDQGSAGTQGIQGTTGLPGVTGLRGLQGLQGPRGETGLAGQPEVVMISGKLEVKQLISVLSDSFGPINLCQTVESMYGLDYGVNGGNGELYPSNESWLGIIDAAICTGPGTSTTTLAGLQGTMFSTGLAKLGLGLVIEVDLNRLPGGSLDNCSFTVDGHLKPLKSGTYQFFSSSGLTRPTIYKSTSGNRAFVSVVDVYDIGDSFDVKVPEPWSDNIDYVVQGICIN